MADNYLEKRMADYAAGRLGRPSASRSSGVKFEHRVVLILGIEHPTAEAFLRLAVKAGYTVCFIADKPSFGQKMAQTHGGRFYPLPLPEVIADMERRGEQPDLIAVYAALPDDIVLRANQFVSDRFIAGLEPLCIIKSDRHEQVASVVLGLAAAAAGFSGELFRR